MNTLFIVVLTFFALWGIADMYVCYRMIRKPEVDWTAGTLWYWVVKWGFGSQTKTMAKLLPFLSKDLTEALGITSEDGEIT